MTCIDLVDARPLHSTVQYCPFLINQVYVIGPTRDCLEMTGAEGGNSPPLKPRQLLRGEITYEAAREKDANILHELGYWEQRNQFFLHLYRKRKLIKSIVSNHLGLSSRRPSGRGPRGLDSWKLQCLHTHRYRR